MGTTANHGAESTGRTRNRVDGPHRLPDSFNSDPSLDARVLAGLELPANLQFLETQVSQLAERLMDQQRELERRERELAVRLLAWKQGSAAGSDRSAGSAFSEWQIGLAAASRSGLDLEHPVGIIPDRFGIRS